MATQEDVLFPACLCLPAGAASVILVHFLKGRNGPKPQQNHSLSPVLAMTGSNAAMNQPDKFSGLAPAGEPAAAPMPPPPVSLDALELPPELKKYVEESCRGWRNRRAVFRKDTEWELKLQVFFGGQDVAYMPKGGDLLVVAAGDMTSKAFDQALAALSPEERRQVTLYFPSRWNDSTSYH
jgi:hypothetical protein